MIIPAFTLRVLQQQIDCRKKLAAGLVLCLAFTSCGNLPTSFDFPKPGAGTDQGEDTTDGGDSTDNTPENPSRGSVTIGWRRSPDASVTGYKVYYGVESRIYMDSVDCGDVDQCTVTGLDRVRYYFAVTAYNGTGLESDFSDEVTTIP